MAEITVIDPKVLQCYCIHGLHRHSSRRNVSQSGLTYGACRDCDCDCFRNRQGYQFRNGQLEEGEFPLFDDAA